MSARPIRLEKKLTLSPGPCKAHKPLKRNRTCGYTLRHQGCTTFIFTKPHENETAYSLMESDPSSITIMPAVRCTCGAYYGYIIDGKFLHA